MTVRNIEDIYVLSPMQQGMLFESLFAPESGVYVEQTSVTLRGDLDVEAMRQAWQQVVDRHAILRSAFVVEDMEEPVQVVYRALELPFTVEDWRDLSADEQAARLEDYLAEERRTGFDPVDPPLLRLALFRTADDAHALVWTHHHILLDGWSQPLLLREVFALYEAARQGSPLRLDPPRQYREYIAWLKGRDMAAAESYWRESLAGFSAPTPITVSEIAAPDALAEPVDQHVMLPKETTAALEALAAQHRVTVSTLVQGAWALLLSRYSGEDDVIFGATVSGRPVDLPGAESMIGLFINTLPVRVTFNGDETVGAWIEGLQAQAAERSQYEYSPLVNIQRWSDVPAGQPLFNSLLVFENYPTDPAAGGPDALRIEDVQAVEQTEFPLTVVAGPGERLMLRIMSRGGADEAAVSRMLGHLETLLTGMAEHPEVKVADLPLLTGAERAQILGEWNGTAADYPSEASIYELFEAQVDDAPEAVALRFEGQSMSYAALDARANRIAHLLTEKGVGPEVLVGVALNRTFDMIAALLGILKAGGAFLPLDPSYPADRLTYMLDDANVKLVLTHSGLLDEVGVGSVELLALDTMGAEIDAQPADRLPRSGDAESLAYVIYTSGSTGKPKGALLTHRNLVNFCTAFRDVYELGPGAKMMQFFAFGFDGSLLEIFPALISGAALVLAPRDTLMSPVALHALLEAEAVTHTLLPPAMLALLSHEGLPELQQVGYGGDSLPLEHAARWLEGRRLLNAYGPTEACIASNWQEITAGHIAAGRLPIGGPIQNAASYILDANGHLAPVGVPGELHLGGVGIARGYLNRPDLTAERFVDDPFSDEPGAKMYKTGDLARWLPDGSIEFLGRTDFQVKIRGFRVELGEIENALTAHPVIKQAVVMAQGDDPSQKWLAAYLVPEGEETLSTSALRDHLLQSLPDYMVPAAFVVLNKLPLNPAGKIDRKALPELNGSALDLAAGYVAPRTPVEEGLAEIYASVLKVERVGAYGNFFEMGGHSLLATQLVSKVRETFGVDLPLRVLFEAPVISKLAARVEAAMREAAGLAAPPIEPVGRGGALPLSFAQQRLWFLDQLAPGSLFYNIPLAVRLKGDLNVEVLEQALNEIVARHEVLRTTFAAEGGQPVQVIAGELVLEIPVEDVSLVPPERREKAAQAIAEREARTPFDLAAGPLLRVRLVKLAEDEHIAILVMHHIASDGWSLGVLVGELARLYQALVNGQPSPLPDLPVQYADYAAWQRDWLRGDVLDQQLAYWDEQLRGAPGLLELPTDRPRPAVQTENGATLPFELPVELAERVKAFSREAGATSFMTLLAAFDVLLARYSGQDDISVGTAIAGRGRAETEPLIGFFVNTLVMRTDLSDGPTFKELVGKVRETALGAYAHQDVPFEMLVERLRPERDMSHTPLFQVMFVMNNAPVSEMALPDLALSPVTVDSGTATFDLTMQISENESGMGGGLEYNTDLFDPATAERLVEHFERLLAAALTNPDENVTALPLLGEDERQTMLVEWNDTAAPYPEATAHALFEGWAEKQPEAEALVLGGEMLTYGELNTRANKLAHTLIEKGVERGTLVGISTERSFEMLTGILGVMKAGGAYLPIDPTYPADRISFMIEDSGIKLLLTQAHLVEHLPQHEAEMLRLDADWPEIEAASGENPALDLTPEDLAYVIYTSGSTGRPKGVLLRHRGLANLCTAQKAAFEIAPGRRVLQFSPFSFDASVWETVMALCNGGSLVLAKAEQLVPGAGLLSLLRDQHVNVVTLPPSALAVLEPGELPELDVVVAAGERCTAALVNAWSPGRRFFNAYGPTETTVCASWFECPDEMAHDPSIGGPLPNVQLYILDKEGQPQPTGVPGELAVGGAGVAVGYHHRPDLTAAKFVADEFSGTGTLYKTGDLCRWLSDGNVEFLGRTDDQVKVRGFRIELGEVEAALRALPEVLDAVVTPHNDALAAYLIAPADVEENPASPVLRSALRETLPDYMIPGWYIWLEAFPLSPAGKVARKALPAPDGERPDLASEYVAPESESEVMLAEIVQELLNIEKVGIYDDFFELGGHSLLATQAVARVRERCGVELPLRALFETPHVAGLAETIDQLKVQQAAQEAAPQAPAMVPVSRERFRTTRGALGASDGDDQPEPAAEIEKDVGD